MPRTKRQKWASNLGLERVFEPSVSDAVHGPSEMRGQWHARVFGNERPITLELGCGKGEYTLELARQHPERNFIGVDIKGHRYWHGAHAAAQAGLTNAAFLRAKIEFIENHLAPGEAHEIWLPFSDPQPSDERGTKRLTGVPFLERYRRLLGSGGIVHVKTDSPFLHEQTLLSAAACGVKVTHEIEDLYASSGTDCEQALRGWLAIQTRYEERWLGRGCTISYLQLKL